MRMVKSMIKAKRITAGILLAASLMLSASIGHAQSKNYCYDHPHDSSHYCFCYHHPKDCNRAYRSRYHDWDRRPDWDDAEYHHHHHDLDGDEDHEHHWWN